VLVFLFVGCFAWAVCFVLCRCFLDLFRCCGVVLAVPWWVFSACVVGVGLCVVFDWVVFGLVGVLVLGGGGVGVGGCGGGVVLFCVFRSFWWLFVCEVVAVGVVVVAWVCALWVDVVAVGVFLVGGALLVAVVWLVGLLGCGGVFGGFFLWGFFSLVGVFAFWLGCGRVRLGCGFCGFCGVVLGSLFCWVVGDVLRVCVSLFVGVSFCFEVAIGVVLVFFCWLSFACGFVFFVLRGFLVC